MSDQRIFTRYRASEIGVDLQNSESKKLKNNVLGRKTALRKIIANLTLGNVNEMSYLLPEILKYWQIEDDYEVKRICHEYIRKLGPSKPKNVQEALPYILNDLKSKNQKLQILSLKTLVVVPSPEFFNEAFEFVSQTLNRLSTVKDELTKEAIYCISVLDEADHDRVLPLIDTLMDIIENESKEPSFIVAALNVVCIISERNTNMSNMTVRVDIAIDILEMLPTLNEWEKAFVMECFTGKVVPQTHMESTNIIQLVIPQLQHGNTSVALNTLRFIFYLLNYVEFTTEELSIKLSSSIIALLNKPPELEFLILRNIILLLLSRENSILNLDVSYFFVEYNDPIYIKDTKLECLYLLANEVTLPLILEELEQYATDIHIQMSRKAIRAIGNLAVKLNKESADKCVECLLDLLEFGVDYVIQETISVFRNILRKYPDRYRNNIDILVNCIDYIQESEAKNAMIWILTNYSDSMHNCLEIFKVFSSNIKDETLEVQFSILNSSIKFLMRYGTKESESICMEVLKCCTEEIDNPDLRSRAYMYWRLLTLLQTKDNHMTNETVLDIIDGDLPVIELNTKLDPLILQELELNIGSIASIYLKPVSQIFRLNRPKLLISSPVLNPDHDSLKIIKSNSTYDEFGNESKNLDNQRMDRRSHEMVSTNSTMNAIMEDYDKPAETINQLKGNMKSSSTRQSRLSRKPSQLLRRLTKKNHSNELIIHFLSGNGCLMFFHI
ncbi:hypothetical protein TPHA_0E02950 [Tetrapisispora phaffii CBS 4417]|uniref:AP complex subunit beta n=1 Tax=Tetrapisispora phaffii (strain ATCC 24235 / CBS 4417 / NBRC 1672 / NRRL Y-8282 / UCD 70-5) TaxID=1071381 RepID=G8BU07_TETPH|nr:hypothetical protein TPHA_0E02950 [Tetrapisispora phaffii CBS 4417]CCE63385.1 hypothetical protein TPHA_0E02950 [Tetrapisispora phaffii CBS 4417]